MWKVEKVRAVGLSLAFGLIAAAVIPAQPSADLDGVLWYRGYSSEVVGYTVELVIFENRFNLTNHLVKATFRGTFEIADGIVRAVIDPRATVFLDGPSRDQEKLSHILQLFTAGKLDSLFVGLTYPQQGNGALTLKAGLTTRALDLTFWSGETEIGRYRFLTATPLE